MKTDMKIEGLEEVLARLNSLSPNLRKGALRTGMRKGANTVRKAARDKAPVKSEAMKKNIAVQFASRTSRKIDGLAFRVGVRGGAKEPTKASRYSRSRRSAGSTAPDRRSTWYWRLVEFGTQKMPARPFMRPALSQNVEKVISQVAKDLDDGIDNELRKAARRAARQ